MCVGGCVDVCTSVLYMCVYSVLPFTPKNKLVLKREVATWRLCIIIIAIIACTGCDGCSLETHMDSVSLSVLCRHGDEIVKRLSTGYNLDEDSHTSHTRPHTPTHHEKQVKNNTVQFFRRIQFPF